MWLSCAPKTCCYTALVVPSGRDVWRIAAATGVPAWSFLRYFASPARPDAFRLDQSDKRYRLALAKQAARKGRSACAFLMRTRAGQHRCALGGLRPAACRAFPSEMMDGVVRVSNDAGCTCRVWTLADVDLAEEAALVTQRQTEALEYHEVVARWNASVAESAPERTFDFFDYCDFVMAAYEQPRDRSRVD